MASILLTGGTGEIVRALENADLFDDAAATRLLDRGAEIFIDNMQQEMRSVPYRLGTIIDKVKKKGGKLKHDKAGRPYVTVTINGKNSQGVRNAVIAFVLNYGRSEEYGKIESTHFLAKAKLKTAAQLPAAYSEVAAQIYKERGLS